MSATKYVHIKREREGKEVLPKRNVDFFLLLFQTEGERMNY